MKQLVKGLIVFGILCFSVGVLSGIIYENIKLNSEIEEKLTTNSKILINGDLYTIEKYKGFDLNDSIIGTPQYPIK